MKKALATWDKEWWKNGGGGAVWDGTAYDPELESRLRRHRQRRAVAAGAAHVDGAWTICTSAPSSRWTWTPAS